MLVIRAGRAFDGERMLPGGASVFVDGGRIVGVEPAGAAGADQLRAAVRERAERRVDVGKIMASGGAMTAGTDVLATQFTLDDVRVVVEEAHAAGLPVTAHAHGLPAVHQALDAGVDGI